MINSLARDLNGWWPRCLFLVAVSLMTVQFAVAREWTDASGKNKVEAEFVKLEGDTVHLRKENGDIVPIPLAKLSQADIAFVKAKAADGGVDIENNKHQ